MLDEEKTVSCNKPQIDLSPIDAFRFKWVCPAVEKLSSDRFSKGLVAVFPVILAAYFRVISTPSISKYT